MDGVEVLEALRKKEVAVPIIVLTANIQTPVKKQCLELGARIFLNKPPKADEIKAALAEILGG